MLDIIITKRVLILNKKPFSKYGIIKKDIEFVRTKIRVSITFKFFI
jgi:hypothetical protein